ncbi:hypothetical protein [Burkholderia pseudomallei]|uniref:hypothetical protein n=1 Tax=Burkholderia pseudomallei TaxID=28450 RepID=UPI000A1A0681|nr:hypothetical protein [Burkholderia pseudomallei]ARL77610.1 hypothetical protein BOC54_37075 [Burkholderia pseudomallei]ARL84218.1 hypothetical protein BOC55_35405 [Burkholderia pseudomallei]
MSNSTTLLDTIATNQSNKEAVVNALLDAASPSMLWGRHASACSGLTWGYYGGWYGGAQINNGTLTLTASTTNYVYANASTGAVSVNTTGFPAGAIPLYTIVTGTTTATSYTDQRSNQAAATTSAAVYDVGGYIEGLPNASETVWQFYSPRAWTLPAGASGGAKAGTAATASTTFTLKQNGTSVGTIVFSASGTTGTVSITSSTAIASGDLLALVAPATPDTTLADIAFTFAGTRP